MFFTLHPCSSRLVLVLTASSLVSPTTEVVTHRPNSVNLPATNRLVNCSPALSPSPVNRIHEQPPCQPLNVVPPALSTSRLPPNRQVVNLSTSAPSTSLPSNHPTYRPCSFPCSQVPANRPRSFTRSQVPANCLVNVRCTNLLSYQLTVLPTQLTVLPTHDPSGPSTVLGPIHPFTNRPVNRSAP
jgi:hypothetical protein